MLFKKFIRFVQFIEFFYAVNCLICNKLNNLLYKIYIDLRKCVCYNIIIISTIKYNSFLKKGNNMKELFSIDLHDYEENYSVYKRPSARGIIINDDRIALVYSKKEKYYKFPGGGIKENEDMKTALIREVREETGLIVIPDSIVEFGSVMRRQKSNYSPDTIFEQENFYFFCKTENRLLEQNLDYYEKEAEFLLKVVDIDDAIKTDSDYHSDDFFNEIMIKREMKVLQLVKKYLHNQ